MADDNLITRLKFWADEVVPQQEGTVSILREAATVIAAQAAVIEAALAERLDHGAQGNGYAQMVYRMRTHLSPAPSVSLDAVKAEAAAEQREKDAVLAEEFGDGTQMSVDFDWVRAAVAAAIRSGVTR